MDNRLYTTQRQWQNWEQDTERRYTSKESNKKKRNQRKTKK